MAFGGLFGALQGIGDFGNQLATADQANAYARAQAAAAARTAAAQQSAMQARLDAAAEKRREFDEKQKLAMQKKPIGTPYMATGGKMMQRYYDPATQTMTEEEVGGPEPETDAEKYVRTLMSVGMSEPDAKKAAVLKYGAPPAVKKTPEEQKNDYLKSLGFTDKQIKDAEAISLGLIPRAKATGSTSAKGGKTNGEKDIPTGDALVDWIGTGKSGIENLAYVIARQPALVNAIAAKYPGFNGTKATKFPGVYAQFVSTKPNTAGYQINAGAAALKHLLDLWKLNTPASLNPFSEANAAYNKQITIVGPEVAKFYGDETIPGIAQAESGLNSPILWKRRAAILTQIKAMGKKLDNYEQQWKNALPSAVFTDPMPGMDDEARAARAALDPDYARRLQSEAASSNSAAADSDLLNIR